MNQNKEVIFEALKQIRGDDLFRCRREFARFTFGEMMQKYGDSGKTRQQVLDDLIDRDRLIDSAVEWVKRQKDE